MSDTIKPDESTYNLASMPSSDVGDLPKMDMERVLPRQQSTGLARGIQQLGTPNVFVDSGDNQIIVAKTDNQVTTNQVLMGDQSKFGQGFYVTKAGIDAKTAKSSDDFIFNSNQNVLKIIKKDIGILTPDGSTISTLTIPHNLGFAPIVLAFLNNVDISTVGTQLSIAVPTWTAAAIDTLNGVVKFQTWLYVSTDAVNFYAQFFNSIGATSPIYITYYLLQETAASTF